MVAHWARAMSVPSRPRRRIDVEQGVGEAGEQQAELVGPPSVARGAVGEELELLFLDPVLHLADRAQ